MLGAKTSPTGKRLDGIDMQSFFATSPETGEQYEFDNSVLAGGVVGPQGKIWSFLILIHLLIF